MKLRLLHERSYRGSDRLAKALRMVYGRGGPLAGTPYSNNKGKLVNQPPPASAAASAGGYDLGSRATADTAAAPGVAWKPSHRKFFRVGQDGTTSPMNGS